MRFHLSKPLGTMVLLALGLLAPATAPAGFVTQEYMDDINTSATIDLASPGQSATITTAMNNFINANPANGSGPSHQEWSYTWASAAMVAKVEAGITVLDYSPFVVMAPALKTANGLTADAGDPGELGGALLNLKYTPQAGAPAFTNLHWIQAYFGIDNGNVFPALLDNNPDTPYSAQNNISPFYDTLTAAAGRLEGGGGYFADRPQDPEDEYDMNPVAGIAFAVVLADDVQTVVNGVTQNAVTLYGGESWGYTYTAMDTAPEPPSIVMVSMAGVIGLGVVGLRRLRTHHAA